MRCRAAVLELYQAVAWTAISARNTPLFVFDEASVLAKVEENTTRSMVDEKKQAYKLQGNSTGRLLGFVAFSPTTHHSQSKESSSSALLDCITDFIVGAGAVMPSLAALSVHRACAKARASRFRALAFR